MLSFKKYITEQNTIGVHNDGPGSGFNRNGGTGGAFLSSGWTGSESASSDQIHKPGLDMGQTHTPGVDMTIPSNIPTIKKTSKIKVLERNKNPIFIHLQDGTRLYLTLDEFKRIKGNPEIGKTMTVVFQRNPKDKSNSASQIQSISIA